MLTNIDPMLGTPKNLECFSLKDSSIANLPSFLLDLPKLRMLNLRQIKGLMTLPPQLLRKESLKRVLFDSQLAKVRKFTVAFPNDDLLLQKIQLFHGLFQA